MSDTTTNGVRIRVSPRYVPEQSDRVSGVRLFAYTVVISNEGSEPAKLLRRHWIITDGWGNRHEVEGPGVVGETPRLEPGDSFEYTSFCPLKTAHGSMEGSFRMTRDDGDAFDARIDPFYLVADTETLN